MSNEKRDVSYILIDKNDFIDQFRPNDQDIKNYYNNNKKLFIELKKEISHNLILKTKMML